MMNDPIIGISANFKEGTSCIADVYVRSILAAKGNPVLIPVQEDILSLTNIVSHLDGLVLSGGGDIDPVHFGEEPFAPVTEEQTKRDLYDFALLKLASDRQIPIFGICRGLQVLNVAYGGTLFQDIPTQCPQTIEHNQMLSRDQGSHWVSIEKKSVLYQLLNKTELFTNSFHHQAIKNLSSQFVATAATSDGIVEAIESAVCKNIIGVQWHPETMTQNNEDMYKLFQYFVHEASLYQKAKQIHRQAVVIDSHCDTPMFFEQNDINIGNKNAILKVDIPKMEEGMVDAVFMVAFIRQGDRNPARLQQDYDQAISTISKIRRQIEMNSDRVGIALCPADIIQLKKESRKAILLGIENGTAIGNDFCHLDTFKKLGVSYITLCHNGNNQICDSASDQPEHHGLSRFGEEVVTRMNQLGIMIDISHASEKTAFDVLEKSKSPIIASHSSVQMLCNHHRNLSDELIVKIAEKGGVVQVCLYKDFIAKSTTPNIYDAIRHVEYICRLVGTEHVGIGSDFDGDGGIMGVDSINELINITIELLRRRYSPVDIEKIWGGNLMRVMKETQ